MKRLALPLLLISIALFIFVFGFLPRRNTFVGSVKNLLSAVFFVESTTTEDIRSIYKTAALGIKKVRIVVVPGHDDEVWGTEFKGLRESDINAALAEYLADYLGNDQMVEVFLVRNSAGYNPVFLEYLKTNKESIDSFVKAKKVEMKTLIDADLLHSYSNVIHNTAPYSTALKLYAINKWVNDYKANIVIHIHFNDYPGRKRNQPGKYSGFSIYVPEEQYSNSKASKNIAASLFKRLNIFYAPSNLQKEKEGIVEDQELIAIGAYNTVDAAAVLIEYGYIYEPQLRDSAIREKVVKELAYQTYLGLEDFLKGGTSFKVSSTLLPFKWQGVSLGETSSAEVLSLQAALRLEGSYPPEGKKLADCPVSGTFGPCTNESLTAFQRKHGIKEQNRVGDLTKSKLYSLFPI